MPSSSIGSPDARIFCTSTAFRRSSSPALPQIVATIEVFSAVNPGLFAARDVAKGDSLQITRSACLPGSSDPTHESIRNCLAGAIVTNFSDSSGGNWP